MRVKEKTWWHKEYLESCCNSSGGKKSKPCAKSDGGVLGKGSGLEAYSEACGDRMNARGITIQSSSLGNSVDSDTITETKNRGKETSL